MKRMMSLLLAVLMLVMSSVALAETTNAETGESVTVSGNGLKVYDTPVYEVLDEVHNVKTGDESLVGVAKLGDEFVRALAAGEYSEVILCYDEELVPEELKEEFDAFSLKKQVVAVMYMLDAVDEELSDEEFLASVELTAEDVEDIRKLPVVEEIVFHSMNITECSWVKYEVNGEDVDAVMVVFKVTLTDGTVYYLRVVCTKNVEDEWKVAQITKSIQ